MTISDFAQVLVLLLIFLSEVVLISECADDVTTRLKAAVFVSVSNLALLVAAAVIVRWEVV